MICPKCGANIADDSKFCVRCGSKIEKVAENVCPGCGTVLKPGTKFCTKCGMKQGDGAAPQPAPQAAAPKPQPAPQAAAPKPQPAPQAAAPKPQPAPQQPAAKPAKKSHVGLIIVLVILFLLIVAAVGAGFYLLNNTGILSNLGVISETDENGEKDADSDVTSGDVDDVKGDVELLEPAEELAEQARQEYEEGNDIDGAIPHGADAINQYMTVAEENNLKEEAQEGIDNIYGTYIDSVIRYCDNIKNQGAYAAGYEQISNVVLKATTITTSLAEQGYTVDGDRINTYKDEVVQAYKDMFIQGINNITTYENWSRDEAWNYAEQAASIKENGKMLLFDDEELDDPLRLRYAYCLAWITRKRCETGLADGSLSYGDAANSMVAILEETDYNMLLLQDIITYGSSAGMDVSKYQSAYNAIVDEIKQEQNLTIGNDIGVNSATSVDLKHFWYFNDLDGEDKYKVDTHNGTTAATREWIRSNVPVLLGE